MYCTTKFSSLQFDNSTVKTEKTRVPSFGPCRTPVRTELDSWPETLSEKWMKKWTSYFGLLMVMLQDCFWSDRAVNYQFGLEIITDIYTCVRFNFYKIMSLHRTCNLSYITFTEEFWIQWQRKGPCYNNNYIRNFTIDKISQWIFVPRAVLQVYMYICEHIYSSIHASWILIVFLN